MRKGFLVLLFMAICAVFASEESSLYAQAKACYLTNNYQAAFDRFVQIPPSSPLYPYASYYALQSAYKQKATVTANAWYQEIVSRKNKQEPYRERRQSLELPLKFTLGQSLQPSEFLALGKLFVGQYKYGEALRCFQKVPSVDLMGEDLQIMLARSYGGAGQKERSQALWALLPDSGDKLYFLSTLVTNDAEKYSYYEDMLQRFPGNSYSNDGAFVLFRTFKKKGDLDNAWRMMDYLEKIPAHTLRAGFEKGLIEFERGNFGLAMDRFKSVERGDFADASLYWQGKVNLALGQSEQATANWLSLQQRFPLSFYSYRAFDATQVIPSYDAPPFIPPEKSSKPLPTRIAALLEAHAFDDAYYEAKTFYPSDNAVWANLYGFFKDNQHYHYLFRLNERYPSPYLAYPLTWEHTLRDDLVKTDSTMDPYLVMALIREESNYNPNAISVSDARGLMQLMSFTAAGAAKSLKLTDYDLFEPSDNIRIGYYHLKWVLNTLGIQKGIAAYNCGTGALSRFRKLDDLDLFIESIPYPETNRYVKKVLKSYWVYKLLYDRDSHNAILL